jgi:hypothetical protein
VSRFGGTPDAISFLDHYRMCVLSYETHNTEIAVIHIESDRWEEIQPTFVSLQHGLDRLPFLLDQQFGRTELRVPDLCG